MTSQPERTASASSSSAPAAAALTEVERKKARLDALLAAQAEARKRKADRPQYESSSDEEDLSSSDSEEEEKKTEVKVPVKRAKIGPSPPAPARPAASKPTKPTKKAESESEPDSGEEDAQTEHSSDEDDDDKPKRPVKAKPEATKAKAKPKAAAAAAASATTADKNPVFVLRSLESTEAHAFVTKGEIITVPADGEGNPPIQFKVTTLGSTFEGDHPRYYPYPQDAKNTKRLPLFFDPSASFSELNFGTVRLGPEGEEVKDPNDSWVQISARHVFRFTAEKDSTRGHCKAALFRDEMGKDALFPTMERAKTDRALNDACSKAWNTVYDRHREAAKLAHNIRADADGQNEDPQPMIPWALYYHAAGKRAPAAAAANGTPKPVKATKTAASKAAAAAAASAESADVPMQAETLSDALTEMIDDYIKHDVAQVHDMCKNAATSMVKVMEHRFAAPRLMGVYVKEPLASKQSSEVRMAIARTLLAYHPEARKRVDATIKAEVAKEEANALDLANSLMDD